MKDLEQNFRDLEINCNGITRKVKDALGDMSDLDDKLKEVCRLLQVLKSKRYIDQGM